MDYVIKEKISTNKDCTKIGEFLYSKNENSIYFELPYPFRVQLKIVDWHKVYCTPGFKRLFTILRGNINIDLLCRELDLIKYVQEDKLLLHASCIAENGIGKLRVGFPNSGKTYETYRSVADGYDLISEEYTVIYKRMASAYKPKCRSCLSAKTIGIGGFKLTNKENLLLKMTTLRSKLMPFMFEAAIWKDIAVKGTSSIVDSIVYGSTNDCIENYKDLILLTENEFPFMGEYILEAYAMASRFDLIGIQNKQRQLIYEFVNSISDNTIV